MIIDVLIRVKNSGKDFFKKIVNLINTECYWMNREEVYTTGENRNIENQAKKRNDY